MRRRVQGIELFVSGCASAAAARKAMDERISELDAHGKPMGLGPHRTSVAHALQDCGRQRLPFMKGARQEADRINKLLRAAHLATLEVTPWAEAVEKGLVQETARRADRKGRGQYFVVGLVEPTPARRIPKGLSEHRKALERETARSDALRKHLACLPVAAVQRHHLQRLVDALRAEGREPATLELERALFRVFFNYVRRIWNWATPAENPATHLVMPPVDNARERVMSAAEEARLDEALEDCRNAVAAQVVVLLTETGMRASEPLLYATWGAVDWERKVLKLSDAKAGRRDVPLSPRALEVLRTLRGDDEREPQARIFELTYESLKAAWNRALERAGLTDLHLQDLRHTAATRLALKTGNVLLVKALTGHKTMAMVDRYMNVKADDVVAVLHAPPPAAQHSSPVESPTPAADVATGVGQDTEPDRGVVPDNVVRVALGKRRATR
ncbi:MAG: hypothetical protein RJA99_3033 [Pseudomonadota bacterium]|jgi:integrase